MITSYTTMHVPSSPRIGVQADQCSDGTPTHATRTQITRPDGLQENGDAMHGLDYVDYTLQAHEWGTVTSPTRR